MSVSGDRPAHEPAPPREGAPEALDLDRSAASLLAALPVAAFTLDDAGAVRDWSRYAERVTGLPRSEVLGVAAAELDGSDERDGLAGLVAELRALSQGDSGRGPQAALHREVRLKHPDGRELCLLASLQPLRGDDGEVLGAVGALTDLTPHLSLSRRVAVTKPPARMRNALQRMVGESPPMQEALRRIALAAKSDVTVLITGESGTGKELAASAIHALSKRAERPFMSVNCSAIPEPLLESELFGHVRGAFTGAVRDKLGLFQAAQGGTLFLDEVGDLGKVMQVKLLRALQEREIRRVGDERTMKFDARIISATHQDLAQLLASGDLREDFYYRIRVFEIRLPALRERPEDIPLLVEHFVEEFNATHDKRVQGLAPDALGRVMEYPWPGNVRQLRNAIEHAFVTVEGERLRLDDLPPEVRQDPQDAPIRPGAAPRRDAALDKARILEALRLAGGKKSHAAKALGISRVTLWKKMRQHGLEVGEREGRDEGEAREESGEGPPLA